MLISPYIAHEPAPINKNTTVVIYWNLCIERKVIGLLRQIQLLADIIIF